MKFKTITKLVLFLIVALLVIWSPKIYKVGMRTVVKKLCKNYAQAVYKVPAYSEDYADWQALCSGPQFKEINYGVTRDENGHIIDSRVRKGVVLSANQSTAMNKLHLYPQLLTLREFNLYCHDFKLYVGGLSCTSYFEGAPDYVQK